MELVKLRPFVVQRVLKAIQTVLVPRDIFGRTRSEDGTQVGTTGLESKQCARISCRHVPDGRPVVKKWEPVRRDYDYYCYAETAIVRNIQVDLGNIGRFLDHVGSRF
jgi:hypothetical protein